MERLTFNVGIPRAGRFVVSRSASSDTRRGAAAAARARASRTVAAFRERYDADYLWMMAFTLLLFFRPQDHLQALGVLHLAEVTAIGGLVAMASRRLSAGQTITKVNAEVIGVVALGAVMLLTTPFSTWPGGSLTVFSEIYVKVILIFALMIGTLSTPRRLRQMIWVVVIASGYIAARAVFDYVRGVNLVEGNRVRGALGGFFENPNDLAMNLVTFLAPTLLIVLNERRPMRRLVAAACAVAMVAAIVCTKSRGGFLGLGLMLAVVVYYTARTRPATVAVGVLGLALASPALPQSFWDRIDSIFVAEADPTGSRAARIRLMEQGLEVFLENPVTGVGAGQFQNYDLPGVTIEKWRVTHNVWLQVASEMGVFALIAFTFLVYRAFSASMKTINALGPPPRRRTPAWRGARRARDEVKPDEPAWSDDERTTLDIAGKGMFAGLAGWLICAFFASVAFNWTFYYVLAIAASSRDVALSRPRPAQRAEAA